MMICTLHEVGLFIFKVELGDMRSRRNQGLPSLRISRDQILVFDIAKDKHLVM